MSVLTSLIIAFTRLAELGLQDSKIRPPKVSRHLLKQYFGIQDNKYTEMDYVDLIQNISNKSDR